MQRIRRRIKHPYNGGTVLVLTVLAVTLLGCHKEPAAKGILVYTGWTTELRSLDLPSGESRLLFKNLHEVTIIENVTAMSDHEVVFSEQAQHGGLLRVIDLNSHESRILGPGESPVYFKKHRKLLFYLPDNQARTLALVAARLDSANAPVVIHLWKTEIPFAALSEQSSLVQISEDRVVFLAPDSLLWWYDLSTGIMQPTSVRNMAPMAWHAQVGGVIYKALDDSQFGLVDVFANISSPIGVPSYVDGIVYDAQTDAVLFSEVRWLSLSETEDIYWMSLHTRDQVKVSSGARLRRGVFIAGGAR